MFISHKSTVLPIHSALLGKGFAAWPYVGVAIDCDVLALKFATGAQEVISAERSVLANLDRCGELLRSFIDKGATIRHAAILRVNGPGSVHQPLEMIPLKEIRLCKRDGYEEPGVVALTTLGKTIWLPEWSDVTDFDDQGTLVFRSNL
jgi:hypothetical protein